MPINSNSTLVNQFIPDFRLTDVSDGEILIYDQIRQAFVNSDSANLDIVVDGDDILDYSVAYRHLISSTGIPGTTIPGRVLAVNTAGEIAWAALVDTIITDPTTILLNDLLDTNVPAPTLGEVLTWNGALWVSQPVGGLSVDLGLDDLNDVIIDGLTLTANQGLKFNGVEWANEFFNLTDLGDVPTANDGDFLVYNGTSMQWDNRPAVLESLNNVSANPPNMGDFLAWDGIEWLPSTLTAASVALDDLVDVTIVTPLDLQLLQYNSTNTQWENVDFDYASIPGLPTEFPPAPHTHSYTDITDFSAGVIANNGNLFFTELADVAPTSGALARENRLLQWDATGNTVLHIQELDGVYIQVNTIPSNRIIGLATVATTGDTDDLVDANTIVRVPGSFVAGNIANFDAQGSIEDLGLNAASFATAAQGALADSAPQAADPLAYFDEVNSTPPNIGEALVWAGFQYVPQSVSDVQILNDLTDVNSPSPNPNDVLTWNNGTSEWIPQAITAGVVSLALDDLTDVMVSGSSNGQFLRYNSTSINWENVTFGWNELADKPTEFPPSAHTHVAADITDLDSAIDARNTAFTFIDLADTVSPAVSSGFLRWNPAGTVVDYQVTISATTDITGLATVATTGDYGDLLNIPTEFIPSAHLHAISDVTGLQLALDNLALADDAKADKIIPAVVGNFAGLDATGNLTDSGFINTDFAPVVHGHIIADVTGLQIELTSLQTQINTKMTKVTAPAGNFAFFDGAGELDDLSVVPADFAPAVHGHTAAEITGLELEVLTDVDLVSPSLNQVLMFNGVLWTEGNVDYNDLGSIPTEFPPEAHDHLAADIIDLDLAIQAENGSLTFLGLLDTNGTAQADSYLKWNSTADEVGYQFHIPVADVDGLALVATTGDYNDLSNTPVIPTNGDFSLLGLSDTAGVSVFNGFLRWDASGSLVTYQASISAATDITGLATVATTGLYTDVIGTPTSWDWSDLTSVPTSFAPSLHTHPTTEITGLVLSSIIDVTFASLTNNDVLKYVGGQWVNGTIDYSEVTNTPSTPVNGDYTLTGLSDTNGASVANGYLRWDPTGAVVVYQTTINATEITGLATVATTGSYTDLTNVPTSFVPTAHSHTTSEITDINLYALDASISTVGKTNDYNDLDNLPLVPTNGDFTFIGLSDTTNTVLNSGFVRWNGTGTTLIYQASIDVLDITGLAAIATTGAFNDINEVNAVPTAANQVLTWDGAEWISAAGVENITDLLDVQDTPVSNAYLRWNTDADTVIFEENLDAVNITGLAVVATTGDLFDLVNVATDEVSMSVGQVLVWDGVNFIPQFVTGGGGSGSTIVALSDTLIDTTPTGYSDGQALVVEGSINIVGLGDVPLWRNKNLSYNDLDDLPANADYSFIGLNDTEEPALADGYLKWDALGTSVGYQLLIPTADIDGLATVAITGNYNDLINRIINLADIQDVSTTLPTNGQVLTWNSTASEWEPGAGGGGGSSTLLGLNDTATPAVASGFLRWNAGGTQVQYVSITPADISGLAVVATTGDYNDLLNQRNTLVSLDDTAASPVLDTYLRWNAAGTAIEYVLIDVNEIQNIAAVGISNDYNDLDNLPTVPGNNDFSLVGLSDTDNPSTPNGFLVWDAVGTIVEYQQFPVLLAEWASASTSFTALVNTSTMIDTSSNTVTVTLPAAPLINEYVRLGDIAGTFSANSLTVDPGTNPLNGATSPVSYVTDRAILEFTWTDFGLGQGWVVTTDANLGGGSGGSYPPDWTVVTADTTAADESAFMVDTTIAPVTITLPLNPIEDDQVKVSDYIGNFNTNPLTVARNGQFINGVAQDVVISKDWTTGTFTYVDATVGWRPTQISAPSLSDSGNDWSIINADATMFSGDEYFVDTSSNEVNITLPASPQNNDVVRIADYLGTAGINRILVLGNGQNIMNTADDLEITNINASIELTFVTGGMGWKITDGLGELLAAGEQTQADLDVFVSTTGNDTTGSGSSLNPFLTLQAAIDWSEQILIGVNGTITIHLEPGTYTSTSTDLVRHPNGDRLFITGDQITPSTNITGLVTAGQNAITISVVDVSNIALGDYVRITGTTGTGNPELAEGVFLVASVGASDFTINPQYGHTVLPTFTLTGGVVEIHDIILNYTATNGITVESQLGGLNNVVVAGDASVATRGVFVTPGSVLRSNGDMLSVHGFGAAGIYADTALVTTPNVVVSQSVVGVQAEASSSVDVNGGVFTYHTDTGIINSNNSGLQAIGAIISGNDRGVQNIVGGVITAASCTVTGSVFEAIFHHYGNNINLAGAFIDDTNDASGSAVKRIVARGSGSITVADQGQDNIGNGVDFDPNYGTQDVNNNGAAYIGNV